MSQTSRVVLSIFILILFLAVIGGLFAFKAFVNNKIAYAISHAPIPPVTVSTGTVHTAVENQSIHIVGSLTAVQSVEVTAQISGNVTAIYFHSGDRVKAGQKLAQIDNSTQLAQLRADVATEALAQINVARTRKLIAHQAASQETLDTYHAALLQAQAAIAGDKATLAKLAITAPFAGHLGIRAISLGEYVSPGTPIVLLNTWRPIYLDFTIAQNDLAQVKLGQTVELAVDAYPGQVFKGKVTALSSQVEAATRNITVQAMMPNKRRLLRPGLFGEVTLLTGVTHKVLAVNADAITYNTFGDYVYVVVKAKKAGKPVLMVRSVMVKTGPRHGSDVAVLAGLKPGEIVVTQGQVKLRPGAVVVVNNKIKP